MSQRSYPQGQLHGNLYTGPEGNRDATLWDQDLRKHNRIGEGGCNGARAGMGCTTGQSDCLHCWRVMMHEATAWASVGLRLRRPRANPAMTPAGGSGLRIDSSLGLLPVLAELPRTRGKAQPNRAEQRQKCVSIVLVPLRASIVLVSSVTGLVATIQAQGPNSRLP